jgi:hypothetical protein
MMQRWLNQGDSQWICSFCSWTTKSKTRQEEEDIVRWLLGCKCGKFPLPRGGYWGMSFCGNNMERGKMLNEKQARGKISGKLEVKF